MKTMLDVIRDTKEAAFAARENCWEVTLNGETYVGELGFKVFNPNWTCRSMQYKAGKGYEEDGTPSLCNHGMHYCPVAANCFNYYSFNSENKVALVLAYGEIDKGDDKHCTNKLLVIREIPWGELLEIANQGKNNTGLNNTGHRNTGHRNTGDGNTGDGNTGDGNTGDGNTGDGNFGNRCTGDYNLADDSTGVFCSEKQKIKVFDKDSDMTIQEWRETAACKLLSRVPPAIEWRSFSVTSAEEDREHPECRENGGYYRTDKEGQRFIRWWENLSSRERKEILSIPNFDAAKFKKMTGIDVENSANHTRCYKIDILPKPRYEVGDKVIIKNIKRKNSDDYVFGVNDDMERHANQIATITNIRDQDKDSAHVIYEIDLDGGSWNWSISMFKGAVVKM